MSLKSLRHKDKLSPKKKKKNQYYKDNQHYKDSQHLLATLRDKNYKNTL